MYAIFLIDAKVVRFTGWIVSTFAEICANISENAPAITGLPGR